MRLTRRGYRVIIGALCLALFGLIVWVNDLLADIAAHIK